MKNLLVVGFLFLTVSAAAEAVSAVTYNPSRLGQYKYLKVTKKISFDNGVSADKLVINQDTTLQGQAGGITYNINTITTAPAESADQKPVSILLPKMEFTDRTSLALNGGDVTFLEDSSMWSGRGLGWGDMSLGDSKVRLVGINTLTGKYLHLEDTNSNAVFSYGGVNKTDNTLILAGMRIQVPTYSATCKKLRWVTRYTLWERESSFTNWYKPGSNTEMPNQEKDRVKPIKVLACDE